MLRPNDCCQRACVQEQTGRVDSRMRRSGGTGGRSRCTGRHQVDADVVLSVDQCRESTNELRRSTCSFVVLRRHVSLQHSPQRSVWPAPDIKLRHVRSRRLAGIRVAGDLARCVPTQRMRFTARSVDVGDRRNSIECSASVRCLRSMTTSRCRAIEHTGQRAAVRRLVRSRRPCLDGASIVDVVGDRLPRHSAAQTNQPFAHSLATDDPRSACHRERRCPRSLLPASSGCQLARERSRSGRIGNQSPSRPDLLERQFDRSDECDGLLASFRCAAFRAIALRMASRKDLSTLLFS